MKLRLPSLLLSALVAAQLSATANADTVIASGVSYDVGKAHPYYSGAENAYPDDHLHCWAASASNLIQSWQDKYSGNAVYDKVPNGVIESPEGTADGTVNLDVYKTIVEHSAKTSGGSVQEAFDWWFANTVSDSNKVLTEKRTGDDKDYYNLFFGATTKYNGNGWDYTDDNLKSAFAASGGAPISLTIHQTGSVIPFTDELGYHFGGESRSHSITCWGYETDAEGNISAMFLSDSDDLSYGVFKVQAQHREGYDSLFSYQYGTPVMLNTLHMDTDDAHDGYNGNFEAVVQYAYAINTPAIAQLNDGASLTPEADIAVTGKVTTNTNLTEVEQVSGHGVVVGTESEGQLVILSANNGAGLKLAGEGAQEAGLTVQKGSVASVEVLNVSGYNDSALDLEGRAYLHDGSVSITDNHATNGGAANTSVYLEIEGNSAVTVSGNNATEKGGAIYNTGTVSIFGNTSVEFSGNTASADGGQDIYNAKGGIVNIYNNDAVAFKSSANGASVRNEGEIYIAAQDGHDVTFVDAALDSRGGKVYVGKDLSGDAIDATGGLTVKNEAGTSQMQVRAASAPVAPHTPVLEEHEGLVAPGFTHYEDRTPATLDNVTVSLQEIAGAGAAKSSVTGAQIISNDDLNVSRLTIDNSSTLTAAKTLNVNNVVIKLTDVTYTKVDNTLTYDLSGTLTASTVAMNNLVFDTDGLELGTDDKVVVNLGSSPLQGTARLLTSDGLRDQVKLENGAVYFSGDTELVPEPATATLSLLALAALAARRKRR